MTTTMPRIREDLEQLRHLLQRGDLLSFSEAEKAVLLNQVRDLDEKLADVQATFFTIGILGGTGVGKSTLMNALAEENIASTSHRRPHTEHVLIYKHKDVDPLPMLEMENLPRQVVNHEADAVKHVLLCDLPDFDSLAEEHRKRVIGSLEHLDVLVWVTSLDKYGDSRFYEFLREVPKSQRNFIFVLNKIDILFREKAAEEGYEKLERALRTFHSHIGEQGIDNPLIYALSSREAAKGNSLAPWNQYPAFRKHVFLQRDMKQVTAIKEANLEVEAKRFFSLLQKEVDDLDAFVRLLDESTRSLKGEKPSWVQVDKQAIDSWFGKSVMSGIMRYQSDPSRLVGPGYGIALVLQSFQGRSGKSLEEGSDISGLKPPQEIILSYRKRFEWVEEHLINAVHRENLPAPFVEKVRAAAKAEKRFEALDGAFFSAIISFVSRPAPAFRAFKLYQTIIFILLFAFFLLAIGGQDAWLSFLRDPAPGKALQLVVTMVHILFTTSGLAALGSYTLLNFLLGFRFYRRYQSLLQKAARKTLQALRLSLSRIWEESLDDMLRDLEALKKEMAARLDKVLSIEKEH